MITAICFETAYYNFFLGWYLLAINFWDRPHSMQLNPYGRCSAIKKKKKKTIAVVVSAIKSQMSSMSFMSYRLQWVHLLLSNTPNGCFQVKMASGELLTHVDTEQGQNVKPLFSKLKLFSWFRHEGQREKQYSSLQRALRNLTQTVPISRRPSRLN